MLTAALLLSTEFRVVTTSVANDLQAQVDMQLLLGASLIVLLKGGGLCLRLFYALNQASRDCCLCAVAWLMWFRLMCLCAVCLLRGLCCFFFVND